MVGAVFLQAERQDPILSFRWRELGSGFQKHPGDPSGVITWTLFGLFIQAGQ